MMANKFVENIQCNDMSVYSTITDHTPYYTPDDYNFQDGVVRTRGGGLEYYDAKLYSWLPLPGSEVALELGPMARTVLDWAYAKMEEEQQLEQLVQQYPTLKAAKENYEIVKALVRNEG